jgi:hypothetical protein
MKRLGIMAVLAFAATGCGTKSAGPSAPTSTSVMGTIQGVPVSSENTVGIFGIDSQSGTSAAGFMVMTSGISCALLQAGGVAPANSSALWVEVFALDNKVQVVPGTYTLGYVPNSHFEATGEFVAGNSQCMEIASQQLGGQITIDEADSMVVTGAFDVNAGAAGRATGTFYAPVCNFDLHKIGTTGTCVPVDAGK